jgi:hypothetical protein
MSEFFFRTEDIRPEEIAQLFVETDRDREIISALKGRNPVVLVGSRGVGKSFLLRVAEAELLTTFDRDKVLPVYVSFSRSSLLNTTDQRQFQHWMLARICSRFVRALESRGLLGGAPRGLSILAGDTLPLSPDRDTRIEEIVSSFERSWQQAPSSVDVASLPSIDAFKDAVEDLCSSVGLRRAIVLVDEAAHILLPEQQRQFFTLFRDLRSPYVGCKAAVYPGVTSYGETFQPLHDATMLTCERDILGTNYVDTMREIVQRQAESAMLEAITTHDKNFSLLAFAASGNPRTLLKTLARTPRVTAQQTNEVVREYYRNDLWTEHSTLTEKFAGHRHLIDWGRHFIEATVIPELQKKNDQYLDEEQKSTCFFWIHRDAPQPVREALRLLAYSGIVSEHATGIKATRGEVGTRYAVNLGALLAQEATPTNTALVVARNLTPKRMSEYGANHLAYAPLLQSVPNFKEPTPASVLAQQLDKPLEVLDITPWQRSKLHELDLHNIGDVLRASETKLRTLYYVGEKRSRRIRNAALAAVFEYLSG